MEEDVYEKIHELAFDATPSIVYLSPLQLRSVTRNLTIGEWQNMQDLARPDRTKPGTDPRDVAWFGNVLIRFKTPVKPGREVDFTCEKAKRKQSR